MKIDIALLLWLAGLFFKVLHAVKYMFSAKYRQDVKAEREQEHEDEIYGRD